MPIWIMAVKKHYSCSAPKQNAICAGKSIFYHCSY